MKEVKLCLILLTLVLLPQVLASTPGQIGTCQTLDTPGTYTLNQSISTTETCFTVTEHNITIDLNGFNITGDDSGVDHGITVTGYNNLTVLNGTIKDFGKTGNMGRGIYLIGSNYNTIQNIIIDTSFKGIALENSNNTTLSNISTFNMAWGISLELGSSNNLIYNSSTNGGFYGFYIITGGSNNYFQDIISINSSMGIVLQSTSGNSINNFYTNTATGIYIFTSSNNNFTNGSFNTSSKNLRISGSSSNNNLFIDCEIGIYDLGTSNKVSIQKGLFGKIEFLNANSGNGTNLSADISIQNNKIYVNSSAASGGLNKSANITLNLTGLSLTNPQILKDGIACSDCYNFTPLTEDIVIFNVSSFSNYTIGEGPETTPPTVNISSPTATTYTSSTIEINITLNEEGYCEYSLDLGTTNNTLTSADNLTFTGTSSSLSNTDYTISAFCNDTIGNRNDTTNISFTINVATDPPGDDDGGGGGGDSSSDPISNETNSTGSSLSTSTSNETGLDNSTNPDQEEENNSDKKKWNPKNLWIYQIIAVILVSTTLIYVINKYLRTKKPESKKIAKKPKSQKKK